jgi:hypothetical protein
MGNSTLRRASHVAKNPPDPKDVIALGKFEAKVEAASGIGVPF